MLENAAGLIAPVGEVAWGNGWGSGWGALLTGLSLGVGVAVPPGPVNTEIARRTLRGGFLPGATVGLGAVTFDVLLAVLTAVGVLGVVTRVPGLLTTFGVAGVGLLGYLGIGCLLDARRLGRRGPVAIEAQPEEEQVVVRCRLVGATPGAGYLTGLLLCATSPYSALFWLVAVPGLWGATAGRAAGAEATTTETALHALLLASGVFVATLAWVMIFAGGLWRVGRFDRKGRLAQGMDVLGGVTLLAFAGWLGWRLVAGAIT